MVFKHNSLETGDMENLINDLGGCGRFQWISCFVGKCAKTIVIFSMYAMAFNGQQPDFFCKRGFDGANTSISINTTETVPVYRVGRTLPDNPAKIYDNECRPKNISQCDGYSFKSDMNTVVNEWNLVCGEKWVSATITTVQMFGVLIGCFIAGHLGDHIGRKPTFFIGLLILIVFNVVAYFSTSWEMYAAIRFILGLGCGFYLTVHYNLMTEFVPTQWRARIVAIPVFSFGGALFALVSWAMKDWKNIHLVTAAIGFPFLFSFGWMQESVRWLITKGRFVAVSNGVRHIANINRTPVPDISHFLQIEEENRVHVKTYSVIDLFKTKERIKITLALLFAWMSISYSYYGLTFGIRSLAGNLYLNMFLMNIIDAPVSLSTMYLVNKFGRKYSCLFGFLITGLCGVIVGVIQYVDTPYRGNITNAFALASKMGNGIGWGCLMVYTMELYPTVVRTIAYGLHNTSARVGSMIAPQIVFLNDMIPGIMYFISAAVLISSSLLFLMFPETKDEGLKDVFPETKDEGLKDVFPETKDEGLKDVFPETKDEGRNDVFPETKYQKDVLPETKDEGLKVVFSKDKNNAHSNTMDSIRL